MKILLAGGAGYIGSLLSRELLDRGYDITVVDLFWFGNTLHKDIKCIKKNIFDLNSEDLVGFEQVIFLAGLSNDPMAEFSPSKNFVYNAALPAYLAFISKRAGVKRYIYASSCSVYGYTVDELYNEESPVLCGYPYGISKLQGEKGVFQLQDDNFSVISLRQGTVGGHSPRMRFDLVTNTMFKCAINTGIININNPSIWRPILDIRDAVSAYLRSIQSNYSISGCFNIASGNYTMGQVGDMVKYCMTKNNVKNIHINIQNISDFRNYKVSIDKAKTKLGFMPQYNVIDIINNIYDNLKEYGDLDNDVYYNIKVFKNIDNI
jgi:nucleoside-diphosphate-sugar epimerase